MLDLLKKDIPVGTEVKIYLISGDTVKGYLREIGANYIIIDENSSKKRLFEQMIGGWDIVKESVKNDKESELKLAYNFMDSLSDEELSFCFTSNAKIITADKKNVLIQTEDEKGSFNVPIRLIANEEIQEEIKVHFLSGNDSLSTAIPVYVGFFSNKDDAQKLSPTIILKPGTMKDYCTLLIEKLIPLQTHNILSKNLTFILWKGCQNQNSKEALKVFQTSFKIKKVTDIQSLETPNKDLTIPLLTRKAQQLFSLNKYQEAVTAYTDLIEEIKNNPNSSRQSISHNYTQLAWLHIKLNNVAQAREAIQNALEFNKDNKQIKYLLKILDAPDSIDAPASIDDVIRDNITTPSSIINEYTDSVLRDDISHYTYTDTEALSSNDNISLDVAERLLMQAEKEESQASYLEAAKAYVSIKVIDDEDIINYAKSMYGYSNFKARSSYNTLINNGHLLNAKELDRLIDGSFCYFVSAINFGSFLGNNWTALFRDYLRMRIYIFAKQQKLPNINSLFELSIADFIQQQNLKNDLDFVLECSEVLISLGARCPIIKENLHKEAGKSISTIIELINSFKNKDEYCKRINKNNKFTLMKYESTADFFISQYIDFRIRKIAAVNLRIENILKKSTESLFEEKMVTLFKKIRKTLRGQTVTDTNLLIEAENLMSSLSNFKSRSLDERRLLAPSLKARITSNLENINGYSSYICSDLLRELWNRLLKSKYLSVRGVSSDLLAEITALSDGNIVDKDGESMIPIAITNEGRYSIDKFKAIITFSELQNEHSEYDGKALAPSETASIMVRIPKTIANLDAYDFSVEISSLLFNTWSIPKSFNLTASVARDVHFTNIIWDYQKKEIREGMFKGRQTDIDNLVNTFITTERCNIPVVFGLTRTGKSSILLNLQTSLKGRITVIDGVENKIVPLYIELSTISRQVKLIDGIKKKCESEFKEVGINITQPSVNSLMDIIDLANSKNVYPIFMFDEFSYIKPFVEKEGNGILKYIREYAIEEKAGFVYAGTYDILDIINDPDINPSGTFMNITEYKIYNIKDAKEAEALMKVMEPDLIFTDASIAAIHGYSGDVPYWIQLICKHCALYAKSHNRPVIGLKELEDVIQGLLGEEPCEGVGKIADSIFTQQQLLPSDPKEILSLIYSIAYLMKDKANKDGVSWSRLKEFWSENNYTPNMDAIVKAKERLEDRLGLLSHEIDGNRYYSFSVGLFRRWCSLKDVFSEFDRTNNKQQILFN